MDVVAGDYALRSQQRQAHVCHAHAQRAIWIRPLDGRDSCKRKWEDFSRDDMQLVEDFDTRRLHMRRKEILAPRGSAFRSQLSSASAAAEHAAANSSANIKEE